MKVFKFGGASVKDAEGVRNVAAIIRLYPAVHLVAVVSAMGKMTNALEKVVDGYFKGSDYEHPLQRVQEYHREIVRELFPDPKQRVHTTIDRVFQELDEALGKRPSGNYDCEYDRIVPMGEVVSTVIVSEYLRESGIECRWFDARDLITTDDNYRDAKVDWETTAAKVQASIAPFFARRSGGGGRVALTQGFIGRTKHGAPVTLGREGSDYSAAIFAWSLGADEVIIWKDVPGVLNADPKWFEQTVLLEAISYHDAIELAYYGATVIHPKTIKPLQNRRIPLRVRSFVNPLEQGTLVNDDQTSLAVPSFIFKINQALITISPKDFSFIVEEHLRDIFDIFSSLKVKINVMQNSALRFSVSVDYDERRVPPLIEKLRSMFTVLYNTGLELITIRHYDQTTIDRVCVKKEVLLEQKSRTTVQLVVKPVG